MLPEGRPPFHPTEPAPESRVTPWWEDAAVILAIAALWSAFLKWPPRYWVYLMYAAAAVMLVVMVRRVRRLNALTKQKSQSPSTAAQSNSVPKTAQWSADSGASDWSDESRNN